MRYRQQELRERHPEIARAFERLLKDDPVKALRLRYLYYPQYKTSSRKDKALSLARIIEEVESAGYKVDIKVSEL